MSALSRALEIAKQLCKQFEGFRSAAYTCPAGVASIGYGTVFKPDGTKVALTDESISETTAELWLIQTLTGSYLPAVLKASPGLIAHPEKLGALTDFAYNLGAARYRASTLRRRVDAQDWEGAAQELLKWTKGGGKVLPGLVKRREAERVLFLAGG